MSMKLYNYFRSSASYRVRIALALKGLQYDYKAVHLAKGEQTAESYAAVSATRLVPLLRDGEHVVTQSMAIIEYLDEIMPEPPLLPGDAANRARIRAAAQVIACDIHPVNNSRVGAYLKSEFGRSQEDVVAWMSHWMRGGLLAYQALLPPGGCYSFGDTVTLADLCLVPQIYNLRRWGTPTTGLERLLDIEAACLALPAFEAARPENQPDAE